jgi:hypothetical protein
MVILEPGFPLKYGIWLKRGNVIITEGGNTRTEKSFR